MLNQFSRTRILLGEEKMQKLANSRVAVFGIGGVGGYAAEALVRAGVGALDIIDNDKFDVTNINRQIFATLKSVGRYKTEVAVERIADINPECKVSAHRLFYSPSTADSVDFTLFDYVVDAIDSVAGKLTIIKKCKEAGTPVISAMGAGNKLDPTLFKVADIYKTSVCPLAKTMRRELRKMGIDSLKVVYSEEEPVKHCETFCGGQPESDITANKPVTGSVSFVPPVMGLIIAAEVVKDLTGI